MIMYMTEKITVRIYRERTGATALLTTNHPASSDGKPVLVLDDDSAFDPEDHLPSGMLAGDLVKGFIYNMKPGAGEWGEKTDSALELAIRFVEDEES